MHMFLLIGPAAQRWGDIERNAIADRTSRHFRGSIRQTVYFQNIRWYKITTTLIDRV